MQKLRTHICMHEWLVCKSLGDLWEIPRTEYWDCNEVGQNQFLFIYHQIESKTAEMYAH
jgi:hypothetical protein